MIKLPDIMKHALLMLPVFASTYRCDQMLSLIKGVKSRTRVWLTDDHVEGCMRIVKIQIKLFVSATQFICEPVK
jgi:hypothetical protein